MPGPTFAAIFTLAVMKTINCQYCSFDPLLSPVYVVGDERDFEEGAFQVNCRAPTAANQTHSFEVCSANVKDNVETCLSARNGSQFCDWTPVCLKMSSDGEIEEKTYSFLAKARHSGVGCLLLSQTQEDKSSEKTPMDHLDVIARKPPQSAAELKRRKILYILHITLILLMNFAVGATLNLESLRASLNCLLMVCLSASKWKFSTFFLMRPWKVGLALHFFLKPIAAFTIGLVLFREDYNCLYPKTLRLSLFLLGTSSMSSKCAWIAELFIENINLSTFLILVSILLEPLSLLLWWNTLGILIDPHFSPDVPTATVYEYFSMVVGPIFAGMILIWIFPSIEPRLSKVSDFVFLIGLIASLILSGLSAQDNLPLLSWQIWVGGAGLAFSVGGSGILIGIVARLPHDHIWVLAIGGIQSAFLIRWIAKEKFASPYLAYVDAFALAHSMVSTAVALIAYIVVISKSDKSHGIMHYIKNLLRRMNLICGRKEEETKSLLAAKLEREQIWIAQKKLHPLWL